MDPDQQVQPQPIQQPQPVQAPAEPIKSRNSFWRAFSIGAGILSIGTAIAIGGYILGSKKTAPVQVQKTIQVTPTPSPDQTANWQTYKSLKYGYTLKYPAGFETNDQSGSVIISKKVEGVGGTGPENFIYVSTIPDTYNRDRDGIIYNYDETQTPVLLQLKIGDLKTGNNVYSRVEDTDIDGIQGETFINNSPTEFIKGTIEKRIYVHKGTNTFLIGAYTSSTDISMTLFNQVLSTFKFIDQVSDPTASWQTYIENAFLSFKYPQNLTSKREESSGVIYVRLNDANGERYRLTIYLSKTNIGPPITPTGTYQANNYAWAIIPSSEYCDAGTCGKTATTFRLIRNGNTLYFNELSDNSDQTLIKQMLSTFQFNQ